MNNQEIINKWDIKTHSLELLNGSKKTIGHLVEKKGNRKIKNEVENQHVFFDLIFQLDLKLELPPKKVKLKGKTYVRYVYK